MVTGKLVFHWVYKGLPVNVFPVNCKVSCIVEPKNTIEMHDFARVFMIPGLVQQCLLVAFG